MKEVTVMLFSERIVQEQDELFALIAEIVEKNDPVEDYEMVEIVAPKVQDVLANGLFAGNSTAETIAFLMIRFLQWREKRGEIYGKVA